MATRVISTKLAIEGESEYRQSVANINNSLKTLRSELALVESQFQDNKNSTEALSAKSEVLARIQAEQRNKVEETAAALKNAETAQRQYAYQVEQSQRKLAGARARLEELRKSASDTSAQQEKLTTEVKKHEQALEQARRYQAAAGKGVEDWRRKVNYAKRDLENLNGKIKDNERYFDEAKDSTDGHAASIDQYGKKTNKTAQELKNANDTMNAMAAALAAAGITRALGEIVDALKACVGASVEFESAMAGVFKTVDGTDAQLASLTAQTDALTAALAEQTTQGRLSEATIQALTEAGYAAALAADAETGAVTLNKDAYIQITKAKIEDQIASLETRRQSVQSTLQMLEESKAAIAMGRSFISAAQARSILGEKEQSYTDQIAALEELKKTLDGYAGSASDAAAASEASSRRMQTQAEKDLGKYKELKAELDHRRALDQVEERAYYEKLKEYRDRYLTDKDSLEEYRRVTEELYSYDKALVDKEAALWEEQTKTLVSQLESRTKAVLDRQSGMMEKLAGYGDLLAVKDDQMSLESFQSQIDAINAYEEALNGLKDRNISGGLMDQVLGMDVDKATEYARQLTAMTDEQWEEYNALWEEKRQRAKEVAEEFYQDQLDALGTEYNDKLGRTLGELTGTAFTSGQDTVQGLIAGLADQESALYAKAQSIADQVSRILSAAYAASAAVDGSHAAGLPYVPFDGYVAELHRGERVLTAAEAKAYIARSMPRSLDPPREGNSTQEFGSMLAQAVNAMNLNSGGVGSGDLIVEIPVNGEKFYRATIRDFRKVNRADPEVS